MTLEERARKIVEAAMPMLRPDVHPQSVSDLEQTALIHLEEAFADGRGTKEDVPAEPATDSLAVDRDRDDGERHP